MERHFPEDVLEDDTLVGKINEILQCTTDMDSTPMHWEMIKIEIRDLTQAFTKFCRKQKNGELSSLQRLLQDVNCHLYNGESMQLDQQLLQRRILECECTLWKNSKDKLDWVKKEGTMHPDFLHLEDEIHNSIDITSIQNATGDLVEHDQVLDVL